MRNRVRSGFTEHSQVSLLKLFAVVTCMLALSACSSNFTVDQSFPRPLIEAIPVNAELNLSDEFKNYVYEESTQGRRKITVNLGAAQTELFQTMFSHMFIPANDLAGLKITPAIEDFQYAIPRETRAEIYEIWLKYRVTVSAADDDNNVIADWLITGYGKTPTAFLKSQQQAIDSAAGVALRDIGSQLSIGFKRQPDIQAWLAQHAE